MWNSGGQYEAWASYLERWGAGDNVDASLLPALAPEDFAPDAWERLTYRLIGALDARLLRWADALSAAMGAARDEFGTARALVQARAGLITLRTLGMHPGLPADLRARLLELIDRQITSAQQSLEDQVRNLRRSGAAHQQIEARLRTIRDNSLVASAASTPAHDGWGGTERTTRRIIIN